MGIGLSGTFSHYHQGRRILKAHRCYSFESELISCGIGLDGKAHSVYINATYPGSTACAFSTEAEFSCLSGRGESRIYPAEPRLGLYEVGAFASAPAGHPEGI